MGGGSYSRDVGQSSSSGSFSSGGTSSSRAKRAMGRSSMNKAVSPKNRKIRSETKSPLVIGLDVTGSNIEFARIVYDKAPMLYGQIEQKGYLEDFDICFTAIGDAYSDRAPLQVCDFKTGIALDEELKKLYLESGGGGQRKETYEIAAYFFNKYCEMPNAETPMFFIIGDEAPYPVLESEMAEEIFGEPAFEDTPAKEIFSESYKKFKGNVFFLQNPYCGRRPENDDTREIREEWKEYIGYENTEKIIPIHEEKSVVDVILGVVSMVSKKRDIDSYVSDMKKRGQTEKRIGNVRKSLLDFKDAIVPYTEVALPGKYDDTKKRKSGGKRL